MNFLRMTVMADGALHSAAGALHPELGSMPSLPTGKEVLVGIRPEHLIASLESAPTANALAAKVDIVEQMGAEAYVHFTIDGTRVTARTPPDWLLRHGEAHFLCPRVDKICLFDPESGNRLRH
jgi:multiple sugar transport system ATP-binding protein